MRPLRLLSLLTVLSLAACDSNEPDDGALSDVVIGGDYTAVTEVFSDGQTTATFTLPVTADGESFSYDLERRTVRGSDVTSSLSSGTGTYDYPRIELATDGVPLSGTVESDGDVLKISNPDGGSFTFTR